MEGQRKYQERALEMADITPAIIYAPQEAPFSAPHLVQAFAGAARKLGAAFVLHQEVIDLLTEKTGCLGVRTRTGEIFSGEHVILAAGA